VACLHLDVGAALLMWRDRILPLLKAGMATALLAQAVLHAEPLVGA